jgi:hypothetical protein
MSKVRFVGLDVHKDSISIAVADQDGLAPQVVATVPHEFRGLLKQLKKLFAFRVSGSRQRGTTWRPAAVGGAGAATAAARQVGL